MLVGFSLVRWNFVPHYEILASISLHGLARRYQRGADNSPAAIMADIAALATGSPERTGVDRFELLVADGRWAGRISAAQDGAVVAAARTYLA